MSELALPEAVLGNPAFFFTYAVIQAGALLVLVRCLDFYDRQPIVLVVMAAVWGATGAAAISVVGNEVVKGLMSGDVRDVFGDAIAAPLVEEAAKGLALVLAVGPVRWLARRAGVTLFEGALAGVTYGAAVGLGFGFTEDVYFLVDRARTEGVEAGFDTFLYRRDFFGPAILHHAVFTAALGAGLGLAASSTRRIKKVGFAAGGFALAVFMHAVNNGLVELVLVLRYGVSQVAQWVSDPSVVPAVEETASAWSPLMRGIDFAYIGIFFGAIITWTIRQRQVIRQELVEEVESGLVRDTDHAGLFDGRRRRATEWQLLRSGQLEQLRHLRRLRTEIARLGLLKSRTRRTGESWSRVQRARREIATLSTFEVAPVELPVPASSLIGRARELEAVLGLLRGRQVRVVTLTGPGGAGKTRLSIEVATRARDHFPGGTYFVELAALTDPDLVPGAVADVLGVRAGPGQTTLEALGEHLRDKQLLLVLDNFEQVTAAAATVAELLAGASRLQVLVTSREPLRIAGEHEQPIPPLDLPDLETSTTPASLVGNAAVSLFVERAQAVLPSFALTAENAPAVAEVCVRLDGLPLAIELAAARANILPPDAMLERLGRSLQVLTGGARDLPSRHQTIRSTIDWSYDLLERREQLLFARLGVFVDGATLSSVETVCLDAGEGADVALDGLGSLLGKSLLRRQDGAGDEPRFAMLVTIREYALDRLQADGRLDALRTRHAECFAAYAEAAEPHLLGAEQARWVKRLDQEVGNLRAALQWSQESGQPELGLRLAGSLTRYWSVKGLTDPPRWLRRALDGGAVVPAPVRAKALFADGYALLDHGDFARAETRFEASMDVYRELDDIRGVAACLAQLGFLLMTRGELERAVASSEECLTLARSVDDLHFESVALSTLADGATRTGELDRARDLSEQALTLRRRLGDLRNVANALLNLGRIELLRGEQERAEAALEEGLALGREVGDTWSTSVGLAGVGRLALLRGDVTRATDHLGQALELASQRGGRRQATECLAALALAARPTDPARAARLLGAADALRQASGVTLSPVELVFDPAALQELKATLGDAVFAREWQAGQALELEEAVTYARAAT